jgi:tetratricopeptide (TPR) repeat protein
MKRRSLFLFFALSFIIGCSPKEQPITEKEAINFAQKLELSVAKKSSNMLDSIFYVPVFARRVANQSGETYNIKFVREVSGAILKMNLGKEILRSMGKTGTYEFLKHYEKDKHHHIVYRLFADDGLNYYDIELVKYNNEVKASDIFMLTSGESLSKTLAHTLVLFAKHENEKKGKATQYQDHIREIKALVREHQFEDAKRYYDKLPSSFKKEKIFMIMNISICSKLGDDLHKEALVQLESKFPNDPSTQLFLIDSYLLDKDYDHALKAVDIIDSSVKIDPLLNYFRGNICSQKNDHTAAIVYYELLKKQKPGFADGIIELINSYIITGETDKAKKLIAEYSANKKFDQAKLETIKMLYPDFVSQDF